MRSPKPHNTIWSSPPLCLFTSTTLLPCSADIARVLAPRGVVAFTVNSGAGVRLLPTLRFAHGRPYLRDVISAAGLKLVTLEEAAIRTEKGVPVNGLVLIAGLPHQPQDVAPDQVGS